MRVAAVALVLIIGAAVVLWFGNTLNSWVLGGLIGGLAALLLSIPISLTLFSFLSRHHDEQLEAQKQEQVSLSRSYEFAEAQAEVYEADEYMYVSEAEEVDYEEINRRRPPEVRSLPSPSYARLPAAGQSHASSNVNGLYQQRSMNNPPVPRQHAQAQPAARGKVSPPDRHVNRSGFLGYQANTFQSQHRTAALRAQRQEALRRDDVQVLPNYSSPSKRLPAVRTEQPLVEQPVRPKVERSSRQLPPQMPPNSTRSRRVVEAATAPQATHRRSLPAGGESTANRSPETDALRRRDFETDQLRGQYGQTGSIRQQIQTGPIRQQSQQPQTGQIARNPQLGEKRRNPDTITGSLKNPLVRRAPYTYEDDPIRQELAQQMDGHSPMVRRSSRFENPEE